jgi:hypothetical protein
MHGYQAHCCTPADGRAWRSGHDAAPAGSSARLCRAYVTTAAAARFRTPQYNTYADKYKTFFYQNWAGLTAVKRKYDPCNL